MKIKLDENLPLRLATLLTDLGHDVRTPHDERLAGRADKEIWEATWKNIRFFRSPIVIGAVVNSVLVDVTHHLHSHRRESCFGVTHCSGWIISR